MRIAVLADIHGNLPALEAVLADLEEWSADSVVVIGDVINRGPSSIACLDRILQEATRGSWRFVRGNHEDYVLSCGAPAYAEDSPERRLFAGAHWVHDQLGPERTETIRNWPEQLTLESPSGRLAFTHASTQGIANGIFPWFEEEEFERRVRRDVAVFCVAHTHLPFVRTLEGTLVVNVGAVGLPFDRDPRAGYARLQLEDHSWRAEIRRLEYDFARASADFHATGFLEHAGPLGPLIQVELERAESHLYPWTQRHFERIQAGEVTPESAVAEYLDELPDSPQ